MQLEIRAVVRFRKKGRKYLDVVVLAGRPDKYIKHRVGVDAQVDRGRIITFLASMYSVRPGDIVWPVHIELESGGL